MFWLSSGLLHTRFTGTDNRDLTRSSSSLTPGWAALQPHCVCTAEGVQAADETDSFKQFFCLFCKPSVQTLLYAAVFCFSALLIFQWHRQKFVTCLPSSVGVHQLQLFPSTKLSGAEKKNHKTYHEELENALVWSELPL